MDIYTLDGLSKKWQKSETEIIAMASCGEIAFSVRVRIFKGRGSTLEGDYNGLARIMPEEAGFFLVQPRVRIRRFLTDSGEQFRASLGQFGFGEKEADYYTREALFIPHAEVERYEAEHHNIIDSAPQQSTLADDDPWIKGNDALCKAFRVGKNSITSVRERLKKAGKKFDYDPKTREKRLRRSTILNILAGE